MQIAKKNVKSKLKKKKLRIKAGKSSCEFSYQCPIKKIILCMLIKPKPTNSKGRSIGPAPVRACHYASYTYKEWP
jgi:hypothetical protein